MRFSLVIAMLCLASPALAQLRLLPPVEFDHPYEGPMAFQVARDQDEVRQLCRGMNFNLGIALGCARVIAGTCFIVKVPDEQIRAAGHDPAVFTRHEISHCNGWGPDHRGAR